MITSSGVHGKSRAPDNSSRHDSHTPERRELVMAHASIMMINNGDAMTAGVVTTLVHVWTLTSPSMSRVMYTSVHDAIWCVP